MLSLLSILASIVMGVRIVRLESLKDGLKEGKKQKAAAVRDLKQPAQLLVGIGLSEEANAWFCCPVPAPNEQTMHYHPEDPDIDTLLRQAMPPKHVQTSGLTHAAFA